MTFLLVARRDLSAYLSGWYGPIIVALVVFVWGLLYNFVALGSGPRYSADVLESFFMFGGYATGTAAWLMSMRSIAEEKQTRTELVLLTSPIPEWQIVFGKYLAVMGMMAIFLLCTLHMPLMIFVHGKVGWDQIGIGYLGMLMYGGAVAAIGVFASSLVRSQLLAAVISLAMIAFFNLVWLGAPIIGGAIGDLFAYTAMFDKHYQPFQKGTLGLTHVVYYVTVSWVFLLLATRSLERRRWQ